MEKIIFLDIDGVLNCSTTKSRLRSMVFVDEEKIELLADIIKATDAKVVLTSTWRLGALWPDAPALREDFNDLEIELNKHNVFISDVTKKLGDRGREISIWLKSHEECNYVILDDDDFDIKEYALCKGHLVKTSWADGLTPDLAAQAIEMLGRE